MLVFTDAYGSNDYEEYIQYPVGQVIFFSTDEMSEEDFHFCFVKPVSYTHLDVYKRQE